MLATSRLLAVVSIALGALGPAAHAEDWRWLSRFTDATAPEMVALHSAIHDADLGTSHVGTPVADVHYDLGPFGLHLVSGTIYQEPEVDGYPAGAFFAGQATLSFALDSPKSRNDLRQLLGRETLADVAIESAWFFTLDGQPLVERLGIEAEPSVPFPGSKPYELAKQAARQMGMELVAALLDREGLSRDSAYVLFAPAMIRTSGGSDSHLLFAHRPASRRPHELTVFGHANAIRSPDARRFLERYPNFKYQFFPLTWSRRPADSPFEPAARVERYATDLTIGRGTDVEARTTIHLTPHERAQVLVFDLTTRLEVTSVTGPDGAALPFAQWKYLSDQPNFEERLVVHTAGRLPAGQPVTLDVVSQGPLLSTGYALNEVAEEDIWYPQIDDVDGALYELTCSVPKNMRAVAPGRLVSEEVVEGRREYRFETTRPSKSASFYVGHYDLQSSKAEEAAVDLYFVRDAVGFENPKYAAEEVANAVKVYNRILDMPLEVDQLRVAATPTLHGRGFEGLLLLSQYLAVGGDSADADFLRAHEVAHEWWGHVVRPRDWPEDRWLSEAFAEYCAMEYYQIRFEKPAKTRDRMRERWLTPLFKTTEWPIVDLTGTQSSVSLAELHPLIDGRDNVYDKGPLVLHMLRYLFQVQKKDEGLFWTLLQDFLERYKYQEASTEDFIRMAEEAMQGRLGWFWDQWLYDTKIPVVDWSHDVTKNEKGEWVLTVEATQRDTEYVLPIPIYVHMPGNRTLSTPLAMRGKTGTARVVMRDKPLKVTLNDNYEALIKLGN